MSATNPQNLGFKLLREVDELVHDIFPGVKKTFDQKYTFLYPIIMEIYIFDEKI